MPAHGCALPTLYQVKQTWNRGARRWKPHTINTVRSKPTGFETGSPNGSGPDWIWHARFLSGTETSATQTRRPGPCVPRELLKPAFPSLAKDVGATSVEFDIEIDSHGVREDRVRGVAYIGEGPLGRPQAQIRITNLGISSPLRDPENTGALAIFVFRPGPRTDSPKCRMWVCRNLVETDIANDLIGPVEPDVPVPWGY